MTTFIKQTSKVLIMHKATNYTLLAFIVAAAIFYMYFANTAVRALTVLEKTKDQIQTLAVEVSDMESKRLAVENGFNTAKALAMGFVEVQHPIFIMKDANKATLSLKTN